MSRIRVLSVAHSYGVALNRRLAREMAAIAPARWEVVSVAPTFFPGDLRSVPLELSPDEGMRVEGVPIHFSGRVHLMLYGARLRTLLREKWDVVHAWEEPYILAGGQIAAWTPRSSRLVYTTFQNISKRYPPPFGWVERFAMGRAAGWIPAGLTVHGALAARAPYRDRPYRVIPLGVDLEKFAPDAAARAARRARLGWIEPGPPVVGYSGRFIPAKGLELLTRVLDELTVPWRALFVGGGPMQGYLESWAKRYGDRVRIVTGVTHAEVPAWMNAMDVLCAPSQTTPEWREQLGRMLIEAFGCGVAVVASDSGEIPVVVGDAGMIRGEGDRRGWIAALHELLDNPAARAELGARGLARARAEFDWRVVAGKHLDFFSELLDSAPHQDGAPRGREV